MNVCCPFFVHDRWLVRKQHWVVMSYSRACVVALEYILLWLPYSTYLARELFIRFLSFVAHLSKTLLDVGLMSLYVGLLERTTNFCLNKTVWEHREKQLRVWFIRERRALPLQHVIKHFTAIVKQSWFFPYQNINGFSRLLWKLQKDQTPECSIFRVFFYWELQFFRKHFYLLSRGGRWPVTCRRGFQVLFETMIYHWTTFTALWWTSAFFGLGDCLK